MSASSKKKLRKDQETAKLTERQLTEQKEAKKLKVYTIAFVAVLAVMLVAAIVVGVNQAVTNSGIRERNTVALTVGDHEISNAEMNYFYISTINQNASYMSYFIDTTKPLDEQYYDEEAGTTWADFFVDQAKDSAKQAYAIADAAKAAGYTLPEDTQAEIETSVSNLALYAMYYGYSDAETYLKAMYGKGATVENFQAFLELTSLADAYPTAYSESLSYTDADLRAEEAENYNQFSSYSFRSYYLATSRFLTGGTTNEDGNTTYSDEEKAASVEAAKEAAESLIGEEVTSVKELDEAIASLAINAETTASSTDYANTLYTSIPAKLQEWVTSDERAAGDKTVIPSETTTANDDGTETTTTNGYYVVFFQDSNDNDFALKNVRHILVSFEGGTTDENGTTTYSDEEKAAAKASAEELLEQWKNGDANEESFAALANENSTDPGSNTNGGLYEDVFPGQMVEAFNDWCYDDSRKVGDTGIVETSYGYHVMYFSGDSDMTYRNYLIDSQLRSAATDAWYSETIESVTVVDGDTKYLSKDLVLSTN